MKINFISYVIIQMEKLIQLWKWTVIGSECGRNENVGKVEHGYARDKTHAYVLYKSMKAVWTNVRVFDEDGEFCDPCEL